MAKIGIVAAGGRSSRTGLSEYTTKAAFRLCGKSLLRHQIDFLRRSEVERVFVVCQPAHARLLESTLDAEARRMTAFVFAGAEGGWAAKVERAAAFVGVEDEVAVVPCDNYQTAPGIRWLGGEDAGARFTHTETDPRRAPTDGPVFGLQDGAWAERPGKGFVGSIFTGYMVFRGRVLLEALSRVPVSPRGEKEATGLLAAASEVAPLVAESYPGAYEDVADLAGLARLQVRLLGGSAPDDAPVTVGAGVLLHGGNRVLLTERQDGRGWVPPGGLVDRGEPYARAAARELREELGVVLDEGHLRLLGVYPTVGKAGEPACSVIFHAPWSGLSVAANAAEVARVAWFTEEASSGLAIPFDLDLCVMDHFAGRELDCR